MNLLASKLQEHFLEQASVKRNPNSLARMQQRMLPHVHDYLLKQVMAVMGKNASAKPSKGKLK